MYRHIIIIIYQTERQTDLVAAGQTVHLHLRARNPVAEVVERSSRVRLKVVAQIWSSAHKSGITELQHPEHKNPELQNQEAQHPETQNPEPQQNM